MSCFYIGPSERRIFAHLTAPRQDVHQAVVVLCYPFGQEYMRAHRAYRQLATLLSREGFYSLRFDYPSAGDSYGEQPLESFDQMVEDICRVVDEAKSRSNKQAVYICGLRFGGLVASKLAELHPSIKKLFLWDTYPSGKEFVQDCLNQLNDDAVDSNTWWVSGYPLNKSFRNNISHFDLAGSTFEAVEQLVHVISHESEASLMLKHAFAGRMTECHVPSNGNWNYVDTEGSILLPSKLIKQLSLLIAGDE